MRIWRISNFADLSGQGGLLYPGRWHTAGRPIIYCAESPAGALIEFLVHITRANLPDAFHLLAIDVPDETAHHTIADLPANWRRDPSISQGAGNTWLASGNHLCLRVPSAILPYTFNILANPMHQDIEKARIVSIDRVPLDSRFA
jgi:RES domain-containing protein